MTLLETVLGASPLEVLIAGTALDLDRTSAVSISQGRDRPDDQPDAASCQLACYADALPRLPGIGESLTVRLGTTARTYLGLGPTFGTNILTDPGLEGATIPADVSGYFNPTRALTTTAPRSGLQALQMTTTRTDFGQGIVWLAPSTTALPLGTPVKTGIWLKGPAGLNVDVRGWANSPTGANISQSKANVRVVLTGAWQYAETAQWTINAGDANVGTNTAFRPGLAATLAAPIPAIGTVLYFDDASLVHHGDTVWNAARPRFTGTITDVRAAPAATGLSGPGILSITAIGPQARLGRVVIGDVPWPAELDGARAKRILDTAKAISGTTLTLGAIDPGTVTVLGRDVDAQEALGLLHDLANHTGSVFTARRDGALEWHDAEHRRNVVQNAVELQAAHVLRSGAVWEQGLQGLVNDLTLAYGLASGSSQPTLRSVDQTSIDTFGRYASSVTTTLLDATAAQLRLDDILGRRSRPRWRLAALTVDVLRSVPATLAGQLAQLELGQLLIVTGFPESGPFVTARLYVEGWTETFTDSGWQLQLAVSEYALTGPAPRWADVPDSWTWATAPADLTWLAAAGWWPGEAVAGRWLDVPADLSWTEPAVTTTWATADVIWT